MAKTMEEVLERFRTIEFHDDFDMIVEGVSKCTPSLFYVQSPDFHKLGLCYYLKILYL